MVLRKLELEILSKLDFRYGNFEKSPKPISRPIFPLVTSLLSFTGLTPDQNGRVVGVHEDQFWPMDYLCQL